MNDDEVEDVAKETMKKESRSLSEAPLYKESLMRGVEIIDVSDERAHWRHH